MMLREIVPQARCSDVIQGLSAVPAAARLRTANALIVCADSITPSRAPALLTTCSW